MRSYGQIWIEAEENRILYKYDFGAWNGPQKFTTVFTIVLTKCSHDTFSNLFS